MEELLGVRPPWLAGEVVNLVLALVIRVQQPLHLKSRVPIDVFWEVIRAVHDRGNQRTRQHAARIQLIIHSRLLGSWALWHFPRGKPSMHHTIPGLYDITGNTLVSRHWPTTS